MKIDLANKRDRKAIREKKSWKELIAYFLFTK
jgi:hypothetical protein